ncbi:unnamed protein product, partial [Mesorhabditis spiculigera]
MSDFIDKQAEESENSYNSEDSDVSAGENQVSKKRKAQESKKRDKKKRKIVSSSDEDDSDEDEDEQAREEMKNFIIDDPEEEQNDDDEVRSERGRRESEEELDDDDMELLDENLGHERRKKRVVDEDDDSDDDRTKIGRKLFGGDDDVGDELPETRGSSRIAHDTHDERQEYSSEDEDNWIVDENRKPRRRVPKEHGIDAAAYDEARDIFGDFRFDDVFGEEGLEQDEIFDEEEGIIDEEEAEEGGRGPANQRAARPEETLLGNIEPSELAKGFLTAQDQKIIEEDSPERYQTRRIPVTPADDSEIEDEAKWIWKYTFDEKNAKTLTCQETCVLQAIKDIRNDRNLSTVQQNRAVEDLRKRGTKCLAELLKLIRNQSFEISFIAFYRKEFIDSMFLLQDLWRLVDMDEKWCHLNQRKGKLRQLMERMKAYQEQTGTFTRRPVTEADFHELDTVETPEQLSDCQAQFDLYYANDVNKLAEWEAARKLEDKSEEEKQENEVKLDLFATKYKASIRSNKYTACLQNNIHEFCKHFGLEPRQIQENIELGGARHEPENEREPPEVVAERYVTATFPTPDDVIRAAVYMLSKEISMLPKVKENLRERYRADVELTTFPTEKGRKIIDDSHPLYKKAYLKNKPISLFEEDQFLYYHVARKDGLLELHLNPTQGLVLIQNFINDNVFYVDRYDTVTEQWNKLRYQVLSEAVDEIIKPALDREIIDKMVDEARGGVIQQITNYMYLKMQHGPYLPKPQERDEDDDDDDDEDHLRVLGIAYSHGIDEASYAALVNQDGVVLTYKRLTHFTKREFPGNPQSEGGRLKAQDIAELKEFIKRRKPHCIVIGGDDLEARRHQFDLQRLVGDMRDSMAIPQAPDVFIAENSHTKVYGHSQMGKNEFPEYPVILREAVSLARYVADPMVELCHLWNDEEDILCMQMHPLQGEVDKGLLREAVRIEFINRVNEVGVDVNKCMEFPHQQNLLQMVCGLGPRKAAHLYKMLRSINEKLESRSNLVMYCQMGPRVFMNCAGFIKINTARISENTDKYVEILDGSRVHPETYEWARKMAVDALEYDDIGDPTAAIEGIIQAPEKLKDLDLEAFAEELKRQNFGNKETTLYDIRRELSLRYADCRPPMTPPEDKVLFKILTKESKNTLFRGKLLMVKVIGVVYRKPDMNDQTKDPIRLDRTNRWLCQWCYTKQFDDVADLYTHLDEGECPGSPKGIRVKLDNGIVGYIANKFLATNPDSFRNPLERVKIGQNIQCRILTVDPDKFSVTLTCRSADLQNEELLDKDEYYDTNAEAEAQRMDAEKTRPKEKVDVFTRNVAHAAFRNVGYRDAERELSMANPGEAIIRPSSKAPNHLTLTWKVADQVYAHVDIIEENKKKHYELGKTLKIGKETYEDLDEILHRYLRPMAAYASDIMTHKNYLATPTGADRSFVEGKLFESRTKNSTIPYIFTPSIEFLGKFLISYLPQVKPRHEFITVTPDGIKFRNIFFNNLGDLLVWFKLHYKDPPANARYPNGGRH